MKMSKAPEPSHHGTWQSWSADVQVCEDAGRVLRGRCPPGNRCLVEALNRALLGTPWPLQQPLELLEY